MKGLEKRGKVAPPKSPERRLPSLDLRGVNLPDVFRSRQPHGGGEKLPNASVVYGIGAGFVFAFALYNFFTGGWFTGMLLLIPALALVGYALHYLRYPF